MYISRQANARSLARSRAGSKAETAEDGPKTGPGTLLGSSLQAVCAMARLILLLLVVCHLLILLILPLIVISGSCFYLSYHKDWYIKSDVMVTPMVSTAWLFGASFHL